MESYLRIRNNLFLVSFWKRAPFHYACRPSRPGKTKPKQRFAVWVLFYCVQLESESVAEGDIDEEVVAFTKLNLILETGIVLLFL